MPTACAANFTAKSDSIQLKFALDGTFRPNPGYELLSFDQLSVQEQELFSALKDDPDLYGVLRPREASGLPAKSACLQTGLLLNALDSSGRLPGSVRDRCDPQVNRQIVELVLDGVLEILHHDEFVHGPQAFSALCGSSQRPPARTEIARMAINALQYAQTLPFRDPTTLSTRLYGWGRIPASSSWLRRFPDEQALRECLLLEHGAKNSLRLEGRWKSLPLDTENPGWLFWQSLRPALRGRTAAYKLYVSPHPGYLREAFESMVPAFERTHANAFKIGRDLSGVLRPDKMIAYFSHFEQAEEAADRIQAQLRGCPAHGVPFTCQFETPLVSWGSDPPAENNVPVWLQRQSWRLWVANRLGVALSQALRQSDEKPGSLQQPWEFAIDRLSLDGVDTNTWSPMRKEEN